MDKATLPFFVGGMLFVIGGVRFSLRGDLAGLLIFSAAGLLALKFGLSRRSFF